ncbi:MAG: manganese efflux pump [Chlorobi bacterium]|nr:manganese efflux pump [Chlorobiota bacterium]
MDIISVFIIAAGLSADSFAVSAADGLANPDIKLKNVLQIALIFAIFQALMSVTGFFAAYSFSDYLKVIDHWIAFILLSFIGTKMIYESLKKDNDDFLNLKLTPLTIAAQSFAASIDALIAGVSFAFIKINIGLTATIIGIVTFLFSLSGFYAGKKIGNRFSGKAEIFGGIVLILLGTKILIEHIRY